MSQQFRERRPDGIERRERRAETNRTCTECGTDGLQRTADETAVFCANCGLMVADSKLALEPRQQRERLAKRQQSSVDAPLTRRHDNGLMTRIGWRNVDAQETVLSPRKRRRMRRLRYWQKQFRLMDGGDRQFDQFGLEITRLSDDTRYCRSKVVASH